MSNLPVIKESKDKCCHCRYYSIQGKCRKKDNIKVDGMLKPCNLYKCNEWPKIRFQPLTEWNITSRRSTVADIAEAIRTECSRYDPRR